ncbi:hypothetical protein ILYODFUR_029264 [Ilyodon furcidens]|uniref:Uncharacterized protein n=1 Tax=Ilyodon furcidens TaxID=33524 RepID=A0ABV0ST92_9TELE
MVREVQRSPKLTAEELQQRVASWGHEVYTTAADLRLKVAAVFQLLYQRKQNGICWICFMQMSRTHTARKTGIYWSIQKQLKVKIRDSKEVYKKKLESKLQQNNQRCVVRDEEDHRLQA